MIEPMFDIELFAVVRRQLDKVLDELPFLGMCPVVDKVYGKLGIRIDFVDPVYLLRPEDLLAHRVQAIVTRVGDALGFLEICFCSLEFGVEASVFQADCGLRSQYPQDGQDEPGVKGAEG